MTESSQINDSRYFGLRMSDIVNYLYPDTNKREIASELLAKIRDSDIGDYKSFHHTNNNIERMARCIFHHKYNVFDEYFFHTENHAKLFQSLVENEKSKIDDRVNMIVQKAEKIWKGVDIPFHDICKVLHILTDKKPEDIQKIFEYFEEPKPVNHNKLKVIRHD